jgi:hypothetical protein
VKSTFETETLLGAHQESSGAPNISTEGREGEVMRTEVVKATGGPLAAVHLFHALREKWQEAGALSLEDSRMLLLLRDLFEPERVTVRGLVRHPLALPVRRAGVLSAAGERQRVEVVRVALREVFVVPEHDLRVGARVRLAIAGPAAGRWLRFRGRVVGIEPGTGCARVLLLATHGVHRDLRTAAAHRGHA